MVTETEDLTRTSATLLNRLRDLEDQAGWQEFFGRYWKLIYTVARRSGFSEAAAEDIVQETFIVVSRHMPQFRYDPAAGSFKNWLLQITRSRIYDALRRTRSKQKDGYTTREVRLSTSVMESCPAADAATLEEMWEEEWRKHWIEKALERMKQTSDLREFQMFYLHVIKNVAARDVAKGFGAKLPEVYFAKYKLSARLKRELNRVSDEL
jgi:RNA polymerase sigma factor (sigma-70 family)